MHEPKPAEGIGVAPSELPKNIADCWRDVVALAHPGTLCQADRPFVEYAANVLSQMRRTSRSKSPRYQAIDTRLAQRFEVILQRLGMTPADRSRVSAVLDKPKSDPLAEFRRNDPPRK